METEAAWAWGDWKVIWKLNLFVWLCVCLSLRFSDSPLLFSWLDSSTGSLCIWLTLATFQNLIILLDQHQHLSVTACNLCILFHVITMRERQSREKCWSAVQYGLMVRSAGLCYRQCHPHIWGLWAEKTMVHRSVRLLQGRKNITPFGIFKSESK